MDDSGRTFYRQPRIYLVDYLTGTQTNAKLDAGDDSQKYEPLKISELTKPCPTPTRSGTGELSYSSPSRTQVNLGTTSRPRSNGMHSTFTNDSLRQTPVRNGATSSTTHVSQSALSRSVSSNSRIRNGANVGSQAPPGQAESTVKRRRLAPDISGDASHMMEEVDSPQKALAVTKIHAQDIDNMIATRLEAVVENLRGGHMTNPEEVEKLRSENQILKKRLENIGALLDKRLSKPKAAPQVKLNGAPAAPTTSITGKRKRQPKSKPNCRPSRLRDKKSNGSLGKAKGHHAPSPRPSKGSNLTCKQMQPFGQCDGQDDESAPSEKPIQHPNHSSEDLGEPQCEVTVNQPRDAENEEQIEPINPHEPSVAEFSDEEDLMSQQPTSRPRTKLLTRRSPAFEIVVPLAAPLMDRESVDNGHKRDNDSSSEHSTANSNSIEDAQVGGEAPPTGHGGDVEVLEPKKVKTISTTKNLETPRHAESEPEPQPESNAPELEANNIRTRVDPETSSPRSQPAMTAVTETNNPINPNSPSASETTTTRSIPFAPQNADVDATTSSPSPSPSPASSPLSSPAASSPPPAPSQAANNDMNMNTNVSSSDPLAAAAGL